MKIQGNEAEKINEVLKAAMQQGDRYVSLDTGKADEYFRADSMEYFGTTSGVKLYNYITERIDGKHREALPILPLQEQLQRKMEPQQISRSPGSEPKDIVIDTGIIHYQKRARTEVFTEEIGKQLRARGIKPDIKELQEHIAKDDLHFTIGGTLRENGAEKPYTIHIEQNENRAFLIRNIQPQQTFHQEKDSPIMIKIIDGSLLRETVREVREILRAELENGNRFVSFPAGRGILEKGEFNFFKSSFNALHHAYENTTDRDQYIVRSTAAVEKSMTRFLESEKGQKQDKPKENEREEKPKANEREAKPSRDQDRSR